MVSLILGAGPFFAHRAYGAQLTNRSLVLSSNRPGEHAVSGRVGFTLPTNGIQSFRIEFCSNSALIEDSCTPPWGFDALNATLTSQTGTSGFIISPTSSVNALVLTNAVLGSANAGAVSFEFSDLVNPTDPESYYVKVYTYTNASASGSSEDFGAMAFTITDGFSVSAEVPPYLIFCQGVVIQNYDCSTTSGDQIGLGVLNASVTSTAVSKMVAATNAEDGYSVFVNGFTMTSGNNIIPAMANTSSATGASQFGINVRNNTVPVVGAGVVGPGTATPTSLYNQFNKFRFANGEAIVSGAGAQDNRKFTISYVVNVHPDQAPGVYSTTLTYICTANF